MKKIKINVLTKEQKEARVKAKAEKSAIGGMSTPKDEPLLNAQPPPPPTFTELQPNPVLSNMGIAQTPTTPVEIEAHFRPDHRTPPAELKAETMIPMTPTIISPTEPSPSSTPFASSPPVQLPAEPIQNMDLFIPYQPDGPPPNPLPIQRPVQILEPNTGTPARPNPIPQTKMHPYPMPVSPVRRGGHEFTATSSIPFSPGPVPNTQSLLKGNVPVLPQPTKTEDADSKTWEIPEIPEYQH
ncbi:hypothetical protein RRF57_004154 [Xylaria bambusicola]|uniref:Uncharacterized protein n=1 Tax=Xylaria bambusicola TaxID=326684 RepID=A0AAN7UMI6_9PEZI